MDVDEIFQSVFPCDSILSITSAPTSVLTSGTAPLAYSSATVSAASTAAVPDSATAAVPSSIATAAAAAAGSPADASHSHYHQLALVNSNHGYDPSTSGLSNALPDTGDFAHDTVSPTSPFHLTPSPQSNSANQLPLTYHSPETSAPIAPPTSPSHLPVSCSFPAPGATFSPTFHSMMTMLNGDGRLEHDDDSRNIMGHYSSCRERSSDVGNNDVFVSALNDSVSYEHPSSTFTDPMPLAQYSPPALELQPSMQSYPGSQSRIQRQAQPTALPQHGPEQYSFNLYGTSTHGATYGAPPQLPAQTQLQSSAPWRSQPTTHRFTHSGGQSPTVSRRQHISNSLYTNQIPVRPVATSATTAVASTGAASPRISRINSVSAVAASRPPSSVAAAANTASTTNSTAPSPPCTPHSTSHCKRSGGPPSAAPTNDVAATAAAAAAAAEAAAAATVTTTTPISCASKAAAAAPTTVGVSASGKIGKARDKLAKLHKRLKCFSQEQLVEHVLNLVRSDVLSEKAIYDTMSHLKIDHLLQQCRALRSAVLTDISIHTSSLSPNAIPSIITRGGSLNEDTLDGMVGNNCTAVDIKNDIELKTIPSSVLDSACFKHCRKSLQRYRAGVCSLGKMLVDGTLWTDLLRFCIGALCINNGLPTWTEEAHNKPTHFVMKKLHWFAEKAASALVKAKSSVFTISGNRTANGVVSAAHSPFQNEFDALVAKCDIFPQAYSLLRGISSSDKFQQSIRFRPDVPIGDGSLGEEDVDGDADVEADVDVDEADAEVNTETRGITDGNLKTDVGGIQFRESKVGKHYSTESKIAVSGLHSERKSSTNNQEATAITRPTFVPNVMGAGENGAGTGILANQMETGEICNEGFSDPMSSSHLNIEL